MNCRAQQCPSRPAPTDTEIQSRGAPHRRRGSARWQNAVVPPGQRRHTGKTGKKPNAIRLPIKKQHAPAGLLEHQRPPHRHFTCPAREQDVRRAPERSMRPTEKITNFGLPDRRLAEHRTHETPSDRPRVSDNRNQQRRAATPEQPRQRLNRRKPSAAAAAGGDRRKPNRYLTLSAFSMSSLPPGHVSRQNFLVRRFSWRFSRQASASSLVHGHDFDLVFSCRPRPSCRRASSIRTRRRPRLSCPRPANAFFCASSEPWPRPCFEISNRPRT